MAHHSPSYLVASYLERVVASFDLTFIPSNILGPNFVVLSSTSSQLVVKLMLSIQVLP
jgi:hypothetical protein